MEGRLKDAVIDIQQMEQILNDKENLNLKLSYEIKELEKANNQIYKYQEKVQMLMEESQRFTGIIQERDKDIEKWRSDCLSLERLKPTLRCAEDELKHYQSKIFDQDKELDDTKKKG